MQKKILFASLLLLSVTIAATTYAHIQASINLRKHTESVLRAAGFNMIRLPEPEKNAKTLIYSNIKLDPDGFSTIGNITINFKPWPVILKRSIKSIAVNDIDLTGEIKESGEITIAGWTKPKNPLKTKYFKLGTIELNALKISLLSEKMGGISLNGNIQLRPDTDTTTIQGQIKASQKQLSASVKLEAGINKEGQWNARLDLERGKLQTDSFRATRLSGLINIQGTKQAPETVIGNIQAGGLNVTGLPWKSAAITLKNKQKKYSINLSAKSAGTEGLELEIDIPDIKAYNNFSGNVHIDHLSNGFDYLENLKKLPIERSELKSLENIKNTTINFKQRDKGKFTFNIKNKEKNIDIKEYNPISLKENPASQDPETTPNLTSVIAAFFKTNGQTE